MALSPFLWPRTRRGKFGKLPLIAVCILIIGFACWLVPTMRRLRQAAMESTCKGRLGQICLALQNYHADYGTFPPLHYRDKEGRPTHSWRVLLLPYMDEKNFYDRYDLSEPWDGPGNSALAKATPRYVIERFRCPCDRDDDESWTSIVAIDASPSGSAEEFVLMPEPSPMIIIVEYPHSGIHWMEPRDLPLEQAHRGLHKLNPDTERIQVLTADGRIATLTENSLVFHNSSSQLLRDWIPKRERNSTPSDEP